MTEKVDFSASPASGSPGDGTSLTAEYGRPLAPGAPAKPPAPPAALRSSTPLSASTPPPAAAPRQTGLSRAQQLEIRAEMSGARRSADTLRINVHHQRARLERVALRIPDFASYRKIVIDDLREAWDHDRMHNERTVSNQVEQWKRLFPYWAQRVAELRTVSIRSLGHSGTYECELVERPVADVWEAFFNAGVAAGASWAALNGVYRQFKDAPAKTIRAGRKSAPRGSTASLGAKPPS